jgi:hypothetical protein
VLARNASLILPEMDTLCFSTQALSLCFAYHHFLSNPVRCRGRACNRCVQCRFCAQTRSAALARALSETARF